MNHYELALVLARIDLDNAADRDQLIATVRASTYRFDDVFDCEWSMDAICDQFGVHGYVALDAMNAYGDALREVCA